MRRQYVLLVPCVIFFSFFVTTSILAQESDSYEQYEKEEEGGWGKEQRVKEMLEYWRSWEMSGPDTNIPVARARALQQFNAMPRSSRAAYKQTPQASAAWEQVAGSQNMQSSAVSGRATDIAFDPRDPDKILYLATSGGGLWKTTNGDGTDVKWVPISNSFGSYAMGAVAVHPENPDVVFAATGDLHDGDGDGLYKSTDAGLNWTKIAATGTNAISAKSNQLIINPRNTQTMFHTGNDGVRKSYDGGYTWKKTGLSGIQHIVLDPTDTNRVYAGGAGRIVRSTDGGTTWSTDRAANISSKGRITLGFSEKDSSKIYASISNNGGVSIGIGVSTDFGETWTVADYEDYMAVQGWYDNACAASPTKPHVVLVGGLDIWRSATSGTQLSKKTRWTSAEGSTDFTHADVHVLKYSPNGSRVYALTDGGVYFSATDGQSWKSLNNDLGTLLFVGFDVAPDLSYIIGGTQDNGTNRVSSGLSSFTQTEGGDGGRAFISQSDGMTVYGTHYGPDLFKSSTRGTGNWERGLLQGTQLEAEGTPFYMYYDVCESDGSFVALLSNSNVYFSEDGISSITKISTSGMSPKSVHVSAADPYYLYVGSGGGYVYTTTDAGGTWTKSTTRIGSSAIEGWTMTNFVSDPSNALKAWTVTAGYSGNDYKKFWMTEDGGKTWTSPATNLPDVSFQAIARAPNGHLFLGHTFGVLRSTDNGVNWEPIRDGLPLADVKQLRVRGDYLYAGTYGRSIYRINYKEITGSVSHVDDPNFKIASIYPNPVSNTVELRYNISADSKVMITLFDELGRQIRLLANEFNYAGEHTLRTDLGDLPSGAYSVVITSNGRALTERLVVTH